MCFIIIQPQCLLHIHFQLPSNQIKVIYNQLLLFVCSLLLLISSNRKKKLDKHQQKIFYTFFFYIFLCKLYEVILNNAMCQHANILSKYKAALNIHKHVASTIQIIISTGKQTDCSPSLTPDRAVHPAGRDQRPRWREAPCAKTTRMTDGLRCCFSDSVSLRGKRRRWDCHILEKWSLVCKWAPRL